MSDSHDPLKILGNVTLGLFTELVDTTSFTIFQLKRRIEQKQQEAEHRALRERLSRGLDTKLIEESIVKAISAADFPEVGDFVRGLYKRLWKTWENDTSKFPHLSIREAYLYIADDLYEEEALNKLPNVLSGVVSGEIETARYRDKLLEQRQKLQDPLETITVFTEALEKCFLQFGRHLPPAAFDPDDDRPQGTTTIPLLSIIRDKNAIRGLIHPLFQPQVEKIGLFKSTRDRLNDNFGNAKNSLDDTNDVSEAMQTCLGGTPFERLFDVQVPFVISNSKRLEHTLIVAGSGAGKTQLLQSIVNSDLERDDPPSLIVIDSTGAMIDRIKRLAVFDPTNGRLKDRLVIIDPEADPAPGLNMFDTSSLDAKGYSRTVREQLEAEVIELFNYVFSAVARELTGRQSGVFSYIVKLLLAHPNANIQTLRELLEDRSSFDISPFRPTINTLDLTAQAFFKNQFFESKFVATKKQIAERLYSLLQVPAFERMFSSTSKLDLYTAMQEGKIVLVNTSMNLLKETASGVFGRFILAKALSAAFERIAIPPEKRRPCFILVDEANPYTDDKIETILTKVRQYKVGITLAYQHLEHKEISETVLSALQGSTSVKYAAALGFTDRRRMAREMETTPEFIAAQKKDSREPPQHSQFACFVRGMTDSPVSLTIPFYAIENAPKMSAESFRLLLEKNAKAVAGEQKIVVAPPAPSQPTPVEPPPSESDAPTAPAKKPSIKTPVVQPADASEGSDDY